jgi:hypothetical protein
VRSSPGRAPLSLEDFGKRAQRQDITRCAETAHDAAAGCRRYAYVPKRLTGRNVREVHFHDGNADRGDRVANSVGVVRVRAWINDDARLTLTGVVKRVDDRTFGIVLLVAKIESEILCPGSNRFVHFSERLRSVCLRLAFSKQVEIRSV